MYSNRSTIYYIFYYGIDDFIKDGINTIYAETTNLDDIIYLDDNSRYFGRA